MSTNAVSDAIDEQFDQYTDDKVSDYVKRFLKESLIQLYEASLEDAKRKTKDTVTNNNSSGNNNNGNNHSFLRSTSQSYLLKMHNMQGLDRQISLLTEWLQWFVEPSSLPMITMAIIKIVENLENNAIRARQYQQQQQLQNNNNTPQEMRNAMAMTPLTPHQNQKKPVM